MQGLGAKIKKLRKDNKDTLKGLAEKIDYDWSNLSKVERGVYGVTTDLLQKIVAVYKVDPSYFLGDNVDELETNSPTNRYKIIVDGLEVTDRELTQAIRLIRTLKEGTN